MDIVEVAASQIGVNESDNGHMKYINWYGGFGPGTAWCAIFVSWCANQAGISTNVIPKYSYCPNGKAWFVSKGRFKEKGQYIPKRGDIVFFLNGRSHTGIVESASDGTLHTIEGNSAGVVRRKTYPLSETTLTGYGITAITDSNNNSSNSNTNTDSDSNTSDSSDHYISFGKGSASSETGEKDSGSSEELKYLKILLERNEKNKNTEYDTIKGTQKSITKQPEINIRLIINNGKNKFLIPVLDGMQLTLERFGSPGKLTFKTPIEKKKEFSIMEGNFVNLAVDNRNIFYGFIFTRQKTSDQILSITAYDQLRYLKNKDVRIYENKTASELVQMIAQDFYLKTGKIEDTKYTLSRSEADVTLFDMIQNALDDTLLNQNEMYVLYDNFGKITLKNVKNMKLDTIISADTIEDYQYETSIDSEVYNQVKLSYDGEEEPAQTFLNWNQKKIEKWGVLQYYSKIDSAELAKIKSEAILTFYGEKQRTLDVTNAIGDTRVVGGSLLPVLLDLGDITVKSYMMVEKVVHKFANREHKMDLVLRGGEFIVG